jgi:hypothetical protein
VRDKIKLWAEMLLSVYAADEEQRRRGRLLNILIVGALVAASITTLVNLVEFVRHQTSHNLSYLLSNVPAFLCLAGLLWLNRRGHTRLVSYAFLSILVLIASFFFSIDILDRVLLLYVMPVLAASFVLGPTGSCVF